MHRKKCSPVQTARELIQLTRKSTNSVCPNLALQGYDSLNKGAAGLNGHLGQSGHFITLSVILSNFT
jgi:hypothetical protein